MAIYTGDVFTIDGDTLRKLKADRKALLKALKAILDVDKSSIGGFGVLAVIDIVREAIAQVKRKES